MNAVLEVTTALAGIKSVDDFGLGTDPELVATWAVDQFSKGDTRFKQGGELTARAWSTKSESFAAGYAYAQADAAGDTDYVSCPAHVMSVAAAFQLRIDAHLLANKLIEASEAASMAPLLAHYDSESLRDAMGVVHQYGSFTEHGTYSPLIIRPLDTDAAPLAKAQGMPLGWGRQRIVKALSDKIKAGHTLPRGRVSLQFAINSDPDRFGNSLVWEPGTPEILFLAMGENTAAFKRGEVVWAYYFIPSVNEVEDKRTGAMTFRSSWYNDKGWFGVIKTFGSYEAGEDAAQELNQAIRTIREADSERVAAARRDRLDADLSERYPLLDGDYEPEADTRPPRESVL